jgi:hypothetical protein
MALARDRHVNRILRGDAGLLSGCVSRRYGQSIHWQEITWPAARLTAIPGTRHATSAGARVGTIPPSVAPTDGAGSGSDDAFRIWVYLAP